MRPAVALTAICVVLLAGCGGSAPDQVAVIAGTSDYGPGENRVSFLVADGEGKLVTTPTATVSVARGPKEEPFQQVTATSEQVGVPGGAEADATEIYVARVNVPAPGTYWMLVEPDGDDGVEALGNLVVRKHTAAPAVGDRAIPSDTPTVADVGGDIEKISTANPPDPELLQVSVADAMAAREPFVVTFATPQFCQSRTCAPVVQVVQQVAREHAGRGIRFVHVEIYEDNDPAKGTNRWVKEWNLPTEPFTFVVDADGLVAERFEGAVSARELTAAIAKVVRRGD